MRVMPGVETHNAGMEDGMHCFFNWVVLQPPFTDLYPETLRAHPKCSQYHYNYAHLLNDLKLAFAE
jgi:hypothetical protein